MNNYKLIKTSEIKVISYQYILLYIYSILYIYILLGEVNYYLLIFSFVPGIIVLLIKHIVTQEINQLFILDDVLYINHNKFLMSEVKEVIIIKNLFYSQMKIRYYISQKFYNYGISSKEELIRYESILMNAMSNLSIKKRSNSMVHLVFIFITLIFLVISISIGPKINPIYLNTNGIALSDGNRNNYNFVSRDFQRIEDNYFANQWEMAYKSPFGRLLAKSISDQPTNISPELPLRIFSYFQISFWFKNQRGLIPILSKYNILINKKWILFESEQIEAVYLVSDEGVFLLFKWKNSDNMICILLEQTLDIKDIKTIILSISNGQEKDTP